MSFTQAIYDVIDNTERADFYRRVFESMITQCPIGITLTGIWDQTDAENPDGHDSQPDVFVFEFSDNKSLKVKFLHDATTDRNDYKALVVHAYDPNTFTIGRMPTPTSFEVPKDASYNCDEVAAWLASRYMSFRINGI